MYKRQGAHGPSALTAKRVSAHGDPAPSVQLTENKVRVLRESGRACFEQHGATQQGSGGPQSLVRPLAPRQKRNFWPQAIPIGLRLCGWGVRKGEHGWTHTFLYGKLFPVACPLTSYSGFGFGGPTTGNFSYRKMYESIEACIESYKNVKRFR